MKRTDRSENYKEMTADLKNNEYVSFDEFMNEVSNVLWEDGLTTRQFILLRDKARKHFGVA